MLFLKCTIEKLKYYITAENVIAFVSFYPEAFDLLPSRLKHNFYFAKKVISFKNTSQATKKLFEIHGEKLAIEAIKMDPKIISQIPVSILSLPAVDQIVWEQIIAASQEEKMPDWTKKYFEDHPDKVPGLIESNPDWFEELLEFYDPSDASKKDLPLQIAEAHFDSFVTTPKRMEAYLRNLQNNREQTINTALLGKVRSALIITMEKSIMMFLFRQRELYSMHWVVNMIINTPNSLKILFVFF